MTTARTRWSFQQYAHGCAGLSVGCYPDHQLAGFNFVFSIALPNCQFIATNCEFDSFRFAWAKRETSEVFQLADRPRHARTAEADVKLSHFLTRTHACVLHFRGDSDLSTTRI